MGEKDKTIDKDNHKKTENSINFVQQLEQLRDMFQGFSPEGIGLNPEKLDLEGLERTFFSTDNQKETNSLKQIAENIKELCKLTSLSLETQREIKTMLSELIVITKEKSSPKG